jgi:hypothetical protein
MELDDLLVKPFMVSDALDPAHRAALASACQQLDIAPARPSLGAAESARVDGERHKALRLALTSTRELIESSHFDLQVLTVLIRLVIEVEGLDGIRSSLALIAKLLSASWAELERARGPVVGADRDKLDRRRGSYLDAVFAQVYFWLARERERTGPALVEALTRGRDEWTALLDQVESTLPGSSLRISRWEQARQALEGLMRVPVADAAAVETAAPIEASNSEPSSRISDTPAAPEPLPPSAPSALLEVSPRFWELQQRLRAFGDLLEGGQFEKARIVARDLGQALEHFDVAGYFPALFAGYFELSARYAEPLSKPEHPESIRGAALSQLYRTDLARFLQLAIERHG